MKKLSEVPSPLPDYLDKDHTFFYNFGYKPESRYCWNGWGRGEMGKGGRIGRSEKKEKKDVLCSCYFSKYLNANFIYNWYVSMYGNRCSD